MYGFYLKLISLGLIEPNQINSIIFTTKHSNEWSIAKVVSGQPFWKHVVPLKKDEITLKTIVVNHSYTNFIETPDSKIYQMLFDLNFVLCLRLDENTYFKVTSFDELLRLLANVKLTNPDKIIAELINLHEPPEEYLILNDQLRVRLITELDIPDITSTTNTFYVHPRLAPENLDMVAAWLSTDTCPFQYIAFHGRVPEEDNYQAYEVTLKWRNKFAKNASKNLLKVLQDGHDLETYLNNDNFYSIDIDCPDYEEDKRNKVFDLIPFHKAEHISVFALEVENLAACQRVKDLVIQSSSCDINLAHLPQVETVTVQDSKNTRIIPTTTSSITPIIKYVDGPEHLTIDMSGHVRSFYIIPPKIGDFEALTKRWLALNTHKSTIFHSMHLDFSQTTFVKLMAPNKVLDFTGFTMLQDLELDGSNLTEVRGLGDSKKLEHLEFSCSRVSFPTVIAETSSTVLSKLYIFRAKTQDIASIPASVTNLTLYISDELTDLDLRHLPNLQILNITECRNLKQITFNPNVLELRISDCPLLDLTVNLSKHKYLSINNVRQVTILQNKSESKLETIRIDKSPFRTLDQNGQINPNFIDLRGQTNIRSVSIFSNLPFSIQGVDVTLNSTKQITKEHYVVFENAETTKLFPIKVNRNPRPIEYAINPNIEEDQLLRDIYQAYDQEQTNNSQPAAEEDDFEFGFLADFFENPVPKGNLSSGPRLNFNKAGKPDKPPVLRPQKVFDDENFSEKISIRDYRKKVYPQLHIDSKGNITPMLSSNKILTPVKVDPGFDLHDSLPGYEKIKLMPGEEYILTGLTANDELELDDKENFELYFNQDQQYVVKLKSHIPFFNGILAYHVVPDPGYMIPSKVTPNLSVFTTTQPLTPNEPHYQTNLKYILLSVMKDKFNLSIMAQGTPSQKFDEIVRFCRGFSEKDPCNDNDNWKNLFDLIKNQKGACTHRSFVAKIFCDFFKIPTRLISNGAHMYLEVLTQDGTWRGIDLGGGEAELQVQPLQKPKAIGSTKESKEEIDDPMQVDEVKNPYEEEFLQDINWVLNAPTFADFASKLLKDDGNPLLRAESKEQVYRCYNAFASYAKDQSIDFLYVRDAVDLQNLFHPYKIEKGFPICDGPLVKLLEKGKGFIVIDWNNFSPQERGTYKCLIDTPPTWDGNLLPDHIKVIGFLNSNVTTNDVFNSRTVRLPVPEKLLSNPPAPVITPALPICVNLYHSQEDWMRLLVHDITFTNGQVQLEKGKLLEAIENGRPIEIVNPPNDPAFEILRDRLMVEGKFMHNGEMLTAKAGFQLTIKQETIVLEPPDDFAIKLDTPVPPTGKKYYINRTNFTSLFKSFHISDTGIINTNNGIFSQLTSGDQIVLTEPLGDAELAYLYNEVAKLNSEQRRLVNIYQQQLTRLTPTPCNAVNEIFNNDFNHIETNDPHFVSEQLQKMNGLPSTNIFYTTGDDTWANLIENVDLKITANGFEAKRRVSGLWQRLCAGEKVILVGDLSLEDQMLLESLFEYPPYLFVNGERVQADGRLIWVSKPQEKYTRLTKPQLTYQATIADYETALRESLTNSNDDEQRSAKRRKTSIDDYVINKINDFFHYAKKLNANQRPGPEHFTYQKYREFYQKILAKPKQSNPVKSILTYHYEKNSEEYAYINTIAKMLFSHTGFNVRRQALEKIMKDIHTQEDINRNIWRIINCFSGEYIYHNFLITPSNLSDESVPKPCDESIRLVMQAVEYELKQNLEERVKPDRASKQKKRLLEALHAPNQPLVCLFGEAGTGKTYSVHALAENKQIHLFEGLEQIRAFANCRDPDPNYKVLYLDEGNMLPAQRLEFLRGLMQNPPILNIGTPLPLTSDHKVFLSGNPLSYVGREFHEVLWDCANLIWYQPFQEEFIRAFVIASIQETCPATHQTIVADIVAKFYQSMQGKNPDKTADITLRDVENIAAKLLLYKTQNRFTTWEECAKQAIYAEIHGTLLNREARDRLMKQLQIVPVVYQGMEIRDIVIPDEKMEMWQLIKDDLTLRTNSLTAMQAQSFKRGILLEGASGIGKSTMMTTILDECGLSMDATDPQKRYYVINAGEPNARQILLKAFDEGSIVILNELNLDPDLEKLLNKLLDPNNKGKKPGFMVLATQNPSYYDGCKPLSPAVVSRMHTVIMSEYSKPALEFIATKKKYPEPSRLVRGFFDMRAKFPGIINTRNFFDVLRRGTKTKS